MNQQNFIQKLEKYMIQKGDLAVSPAKAANAIGCSNVKELLNAARTLESEGKLIFTKKGNLLSTTACGLFPAKIISQSQHFSFARPENGGADIYISERAMHGAMLGDMVLVGHVQQAYKGPSGRVEKILKEGLHTVTGTVVKSAQGYSIKPDAAFRYELPIRRTDKTGIWQEGQKVLATLSWSKKKDIIRAEVTKTYGRSDSARICADAIIDANGITVPFSEKALEEAARLKKAGIQRKDLKNRLDLRDELIFTIDGADAKDLDDAISVEKLENGWKLGVHIADVSHYVREGSALDEEAFSRGTSVYFADRVIPMLPTDISNGLCSLNAGEDKLAFSAVISLDQSGKIVSYSFQKTVIRSKVRGVYAEINQIFNGTASEKLVKKYEIVSKPLMDARELALLLKKRAASRGTMDLDSTESRFVLNENGVCINIFPRQSGEAEQLIEQMMITANEAAASYAKSLEIPFVYRIHEHPSPDRLETLADLASKMGFDVRRIKEGVQPSDLAKLLKKANETRYSRIISHQLLRTMAKARYDSAPAGHFGLALDDYCHFTSPIRRYPDTAIHRILSDVASGMSKKELRKKYQRFVAEAARHSSECEVRAMTAERSAEDCYIAEYMSAHVGETFSGIISGVTEWGIYVELENTAEGFIRADMLPKRMEYDGFLTWRENGGKKQLTIGDCIDIIVAGADIASGQVDFIPASSNSSNA